MTIITDPGFHISDSNDKHHKNDGRNGDGRSKDIADTEETLDLEAEVDIESGIQLQADLETDGAVEADADATLETESDIEAESDIDIDSEADDDREADDDADDIDLDIEDRVEPETEESRNQESASDEPDTDLSGDAAQETVDEPRSAIEAEIEVADGPDQDPVDAVRTQDSKPTVDDLWTSRQGAQVLRRVLAVLVALGTVGYVLGAIQGPSHTARAEFVYTLDESVPDSFLREDRRLLTQVVTFRSDAVLTPLADRFDLTVDELRAKIDVQTLDLSEVLRLDVSDSDAATAVALNQAILDQYLRVITDASPVGDGSELETRRAEIAEQLTAADAALLELARAGERDVTLQLQQESLQRRVDAKSEQINRIEQDLNGADASRLGTAAVTALDNTLTAAEAELSDLEGDLIAIGAERAALVTETRTEPALLREIERLEAKLATIDTELAERELAPLVASPIRELSEPVVLTKSRHLVGLQGLALGLLVATPIAAVVGYRTRRRQLWLG